MVTEEDGRNSVIIDEVSFSACARRGRLFYRAMSDGKLSLRPLSKGKADGNIRRRVSGQTMGSSTA
uniref:Putative ovule protein n=1 Tax=Solanum chacoense TaxID=4108 RepID=A0A0V0HDH1_SOLCH